MVEYDMSVSWWSVLESEFVMLLLWWSERGELTHTIRNNCPASPEI